MRTLLTIVAFSLIVAVAAPAFAGGIPKTQAAREQRGVMIPVLGCGRHLHSLGRDR